MAYKILLERSVIKSIEKLNKQDISNIKVAISELSGNPRPYDYIKLKGEEAYRVRVGNYRIIYEIHDKILVVKIVAVGSRKDIYKNPN